MKLTNTEQIAILATSVVLSFVAGFYVRGAAVRDAIVIETETGVSAAVQETAVQTVSDAAKIQETDAQYSAAVSAEASATDDVYFAEEASSSDSAADEAQRAEASGLLDLNTASAQELETLPGIGPVLAQRIIDYREANGGFRTVEEVLCVSGIGEKTFEKIADYVEVGD